MKARAEEEAEPDHFVVKKRRVLSAVRHVPELGKSERQGQNATFRQPEAVLVEQCIAGLDWSLRRPAAAHIAEAVAFRYDDRLRR